MRVRRTGGRRKRRLARPPIRRIAGWAGVDRNPLRRGIDRVERLLWLILVIAFFYAGPTVVPMAGQAARAGGMAEVKREQSWQQVKAVLLRHAPYQAYGYNASGAVWVKGRWQAPDGRRQYGLVPTVVGAPAGTVVRVWVNHAGQLTNAPPLTARDIGGRVLAFKVLAGIGLAVTLLLLACMIRWLTNRRRLAYWGCEWATIGPRWSTRRK
jgi:hypothetical protein